MYPLNLPEFAPRLKENEIFCQVRKKWVVLTPEEWVRQHFLNLLINHLDYPKGMIRLEHSLKYFKNLKRSDIIVLDRQGETFLLVECKSHKVALDQKTVNQISQYNKVLDSQYISISNGMKHFLWRKTNKGFEQIERFPEYH